MRAKEAPDVEALSSQSTKVATKVGQNRMV
jgi:hypothetical protein